MHSSNSGSASSGSLRSEINKVIGFAKMIVAGTGANSEGFVVRFIASDNIKVMQDVTADKRALAYALVAGGVLAITVPNHNEKLFYLFVTLAGGYSERLLGQFAERAEAAHAADRFQLNGAECLHV